MKKSENCKNAFLTLKNEGGKAKSESLCRKQDNKVVTEEECQFCSMYKSRFIEFPITVNSIKSEDFEYDYRRSGNLVKVRPCGKEYENKTYIGLLIGELPSFNSISFAEGTGELKVRAITNPAIYVFELKKLVFGCESWWSVISDEKEISNITDENIDNCWYVKFLKKIMQDNQNASE